MKALIISVTCGQGHNSTARALMKTLSERGFECEFLDCFEHINRILANIIDDGYQLFTKTVPKPYAAFYKRAEKRKKPELFSKMKATNTILASKLRNYIEESNPDVIITTHCFASAMVSILKENNVIHSKNIAIVTDFTVHPFWEDSVNFDYIVVANELLNNQLLKKGFKKEQILTTGIPIDTKFSDNQHNKIKVREDLGLDPDKLTLLLMSGSMGYGNIKKTVSILDKVNADFQTIVVCGNNEEAKHKVEKMRKSKKFVTFGYVNNVDELMEASDCIITKPGGLTTSEALAMDLPLIVVNPIPGQEERNRDFLLNNGAAVSVDETCPLDDVLYQLFKNPGRIVNMKECISYIKKPTSTYDLAEFISNLQFE
ncbi:MAG: glycosyltransferase [Ruminococcaceae bacterium]|nr:glycosyltransferase [Oscillospiraceae bacterium]